MSRARPWVLGIGASHNGAVCLLHGDEIVVAIQEERLVRTKRAQLPGSRRSLAIEYCLEYARIGVSDLSLIAIAPSYFSDQGLDDVTLNPQLRPVSHGVTIVRVAHHMAHAVGAFATSGFESSAVLVVDGCGSPWHELDVAEQGAVVAGQVKRFARPGRTAPSEIISTYAARGTDVRPIEKHISSRPDVTREGMAAFWSLGMMYAAVSHHIFQSGFDSAGKLMGLAPYGRPTTPVSDFYRIVDGTFEFSSTVPDRYRDHDPWPHRQQEYQDLAASTQRALEEALIHLIERLRQTSDSRRLCYAGGVALNSVANELIIRHGAFDEVFIMPAAEDSGTAIGAAYCGLWQLTGRNTRPRLRNDAVGRVYTEAEVDRAIGACPAIHCRTSASVLADTADMLAQGKIVGWFDGRSELGPRALGQRSILCDPCNPAMKDVLNGRVKFREAFRPFAPLVPLDRVAEVVDGGCESPYMLRVVKFREDVQPHVPAVVHVDGTGRLQTITAASHARLYELIGLVAERTGWPVLLNTSFNIAGEPIVETPEDALRCLLLTGLDACVLGDRIVMKAPEYESVLDLRLTLRVDSLLLEQPGHSATSRAASYQKPAVLFIDTTHIDRYATSELAGRHPGPVLRLSRSSRWGAVQHTTNAGVLQILKRIDGRRTGEEVRQALNAELGLQIDAEALRKSVALLVGASIVALHAPAAWTRATDDLVDLAIGPPRR